MFNRELLIAVVEFGTRNFRHWWRQDGALHESIESGFAQLFGLFGIYSVMTGSPRLGVVLRPLKLRHGNRADLGDGLLHIDRRRHRPANASSVLTFSRFIGLESERLRERFAARKDRMIAVKQRRTIEAGERAERPHIRREM
jgi:hypothetical protein